MLGGGFAPSAHVRRTWSADPATLAGAPVRYATATGAVVAAGFAAIAAINDLGRSPMWTWVIWACSAVAVLLACSVTLVPRVCFYGSGATVFVLVADGATAGAVTALRDPLTAAILVTGALAILGVFAVFYLHTRAFATHVVVAGGVSIATVCRTDLLGRDLLVAVTAVWLSTGMHLLCRVYWQQLQRDAQLAFFDPLTGTANRAGLERNLAGLLVDTQSDEPTLVLVVDLDRFKRINDTYGHSEGDRVLVATADHLHRHFGGHATISRSGGEEFVVLLNASRPVARHLATTLDPVIAGPADSPLVTISSGATLWKRAEARSRMRLDDALRGLDSAMHRADSLMYAAKHDGGARLYTDL